jgi:2-haloacid dehalogenase
MTEIRHIVFDVGKVLVHYDPHQAYYELIPSALEREAFLRDVCSSAWNIEQDRGRSWEEAEAEAISRHPDKHELIRAFRKNWHLMVSHEYPESIAIFRTLIANGHDVTLLTNFAKDTFREAQRRFPALAESRGVTVSGEVRLIKPDPAIYEHHTRSFALTPSATLFIDDSPTNIEAALAFGWNAEIFTDVDKLCEDFGRYGIAY